MGQTVLILGGGVGGLVAANRLRAALPDEHRVVLVERDAAFVFAPSLLWLITGDRTADKISRPLARLERKGIELVRGEIQKIDAERREVTVDGRAIVGNYLVIALGAELAPESIPGLAEAGHSFYSLAGAEALRDALASFTGGRLVVLTAAPAYNCPAAPYEAAMLLEHHCRKRKIRDKTQIDLFAAEPGPMGVAGPEVSKGVRQMVESKGIDYHPEHQIAEVDPAARRLKFKNGVEASYDLLAYAEAEAVAENVTRAITGKGQPATFNGEGECFVETGDGKAGYGKGNFYGEPIPQVKLHSPGRRWHAGKVLFEKYWLKRWF